MLLIAAIAVLLLGAGITYAWYYQNAAMATLMEILPPDSITIIPVTDNGVDLTQLDLDFRDGVDKKDDDGTIYIRRPVCIRSTSPIHRLEIVHTTNLKNLTFAIYPTTMVDGGVVKPAEGAPSIAGEYKNETALGSKLAKQEELKNYKSTSDVADVHAYPLYWLAVNSAMSGHEQGNWTVVTSYSKDEYDPVKMQELTYYYTYYYIEISWLETTKETDLFYVMAQNIVPEGSGSQP